MVLVDTDTTNVKELHIDEKDLTKFENLLRQRKPERQASFTSRNTRNSSLDESFLFNALNKRMLCLKSIHGDAANRSSSIAAELNERHCRGSLDEFLSLKKRVPQADTLPINNNVSLSSSSESSSLETGGSTSPSPSANSYNLLAANEIAKSNLTKDDTDSSALSNRISDDKLVDEFNFNGEENFLPSFSISSDLEEEDDDEDEEEEDDDRSSYSSRRETIVFKRDHNETDQMNTFESSLITFRNSSNLTGGPVGTTLFEDPDENHLDSIKILEPNVEAEKLSLSEVTSLNEAVNSGTSTTGFVRQHHRRTSMACEVASISNLSLSSMTSNYSQFDFLHPNNLNNPTRLTPSPPPPQAPPQSNPTPKASNQSSLSSFFFSNSLFKGNAKKPPVIHEKNEHLTPTNSFSGNSSSSFHSNTPSNKFDLSKLLNFNPLGKANGDMGRSKLSAAMPYSLHSSSSSLSHVADNQSIKSNHSNHNVNSNNSSSSMSTSVSADLKMPSSVLIFENRPSNLPAKSQQEANKHKQEYEKMVNIAKKKEQKENEMKIKKYQQQIKKEDFMANSLRIWNNEILKNWTELKNEKRTQQLWWHGLPPSIRGKVWKLAIGNELNLTKESYVFYERKSREKLELLSRRPTDRSTNSSENETFPESSVELIKLDVSRTFPQLCFFQRDGPYHEALHSVLGAYACFNTKMGYVQGMSFLTAILLLNMEAPDAFVCLANLLNTKYLLACFCMDQTKMNRYFRVHQILLEHNIPKLYRHFEEQKVKPDLYLIEWIFTLFSKSLPLDVMSRVWDVFFRDQEEFLFRTALGILNMYKDTLIEMDFIHIVKFLTKLPENINCTQLFKSIEQMSTNIDESYFTFENLIFQVITSPSAFKS